MAVLRALLSCALLCTVGCSRVSQPEPVRGVDASVPQAVERDAGVLWLLADASLPALASGYELYAWEQGAALRYTLLSWTERAKTPDEIRGDVADHQNGAWVRVTGEGLGNLRAALARIPQRSSVIFESYPGLPILTEATQAAVVALLLARSATSSDGGTSASVIGKSAQLCTRTGGRVETSYCCMTSRPFPDTCSVGACGCAPEQSKLTPYCVCPEGTCFGASGCAPGGR